MIEENARVVEIVGDDALLQVQAQSSCGSCSVSKGCGTSVLSKVVGRKFTHFKVVNSANAKAGDTVVVGIKEGVLVKGSLMIYIIPVMGMLMFALLADFVFSADLDARDAMIAISAITGLISGSFLSRWYFNRQSSEQLYSPVMLRKVI